MNESVNEQLFGTSSSVASQLFGNQNSVSEQLFGNSTASNPYNDNYEYDDSYEDEDEDEDELLIDDLPPVFQSNSNSLEIESIIDQLKTNNTANIQSSDLFKTLMDIIPLFKELNLPLVNLIIINQLNSN